MIAVIQVFVYPNAYNEHLVWGIDPDAASDAGDKAVISVDYLIDRMSRRRATAVRLRVKCDHGRVAGFPYTFRRRGGESERRARRALLPGTGLRRRQANRESKAIGHQSAIVSRLLLSRDG